MEKEVYVYSTLFNVLKYLSDLQRISVFLGNSKFRYGQKVGNVNLVFWVLYIFKSPFKQNG